MFNKNQTIVNKLFFRKNGFIIEFIKLDIYFIYYGLKRMLAFLVDMTIFLALQGLLIFLFKFSIIGSSLISFFLYLSYILSSIYFFKNKTLGLLLSNLSIGDFDGHFLSKSRFLNRALFTSIFIIPFLGWMFIIISILSIFFNRGLSPIDLFTKTQIFTQPFNSKVINIYKNVKEKGI